MLVNYINQSADTVKFIIAPHNIKQEQILNLKSSIKKKTILYSEYNDEIPTRAERTGVSKQVRNDKLKESQVFIIDTIGLLTKIYSYADIAYVGGGFGNPGVHNLLEPAAFGVPIVIGSNYSHFAEATALVQAQGCTSIKTQEELNNAFNLLLNNIDERNEKGHICETFVKMNKGATQKIIDFVTNQKHV